MSKFKPIVLQSDFGLKDGAIAAMKGVIFGINPEISVYDNTHAIPPFSIWEAGIRLLQIADCWPSDTIFVSVVDPSVGSKRKSIVLKTKHNQYFVSPDNGTLMFVAQKYGIEEIREIDEAINRRAHTEHSYTFHGRDVYAYTAGKLATGLIKFEEVGPKLINKVVQLHYLSPNYADGIVKGCIWCIDKQFGNVWTDISRNVMSKCNLQVGKTYQVTVTKNNKTYFAGKLQYGHSFADVPSQTDVMFFDSIDTIAFATNLGNFAKKYNIGFGFEWEIKIATV